MEESKYEHFISLGVLLFYMPSINTGLKKTDFKEGILLRRDIDGKSIVFAMVNGKLFAMDYMFT
jgi:hypothetical protein